VALDPFVYFYARLAHALMPGFLYARIPTDGLWFQFVTIERDFFLCVKRGQSRFQKGPLHMERGQYPAPCASRYPGPGPIGPSDASRFRYRKACDASHLGYVVTVMRHGLLETRYVIEHLNAGPVRVIGLDGTVHSSGCLSFRAKWTPSPRPNCLT
jgi:hypothetical protein